MSWRNIKSILPLGKEIEIVSSSQYEQHIWDTVYLTSIALSLAHSWVLYCSDPCIFQYIKWDIAVAQHSEYK